MAEEDREIFQRYVESLFRHAKRVTRLDAVLRAEALDLPDELVGIVDLLPPGTYTRQRLCNQFNSALKGHGWTTCYRTVE